MALKDYNQWLECTQGSLKEELENIKNNSIEIEKRFLTELSFGTAGLRGILGAGTSRMNVHTVGAATQAFAEVVAEQGKGKTVAIACDSRINSMLFAKTAAQVFAANGIKAWIFDRIMPTPTLSFAVRQLGCSAGVMITASHNPAEYNGYKAYGEDGGQLTPDKADKIGKRMWALDCFRDVKSVSFEDGKASGLIQTVPEDVVDAYIASVSKLGADSARELNAKLPFVYTPLNGAGLECVCRVLREKGFDSMHIVEQQAAPDGNFPTCPYPNPEIPEAMAAGIALCKDVGAKMLIATDPDSDRLGVWSAQAGGEGRLLNGNEIAALLLDYICSGRVRSKTMPNKPVAVKSVVSSEFADKIAQSYGVEMRTVLTGFKYTAQVIAQLEQEGRADDFIFGFEESHGYLSGTHVRDKDGVNAALLICELAAKLWENEKTLADHLEELYQKHGRMFSRVVTKKFDGVHPMKDMNEAMDRLRKNSPAEFMGEKVTESTDFLSGVTVKADGTVSVADCEKTNMLRWRIGEDTRMIVRPSGTEPKMKIYFDITAPNLSQAADKADAFTKSLFAML